MQEYCEPLRQLYKVVPLFEYSNLTDLESVFREYSAIMLIASETIEYKNLTLGLNSNLHEINLLISQAIQFQTQISGKVYFDLAVRNLIVDIDLLLDIIKYSSN